MGLQGAQGLSHLYRTAPDRPREHQGLLRRRLGHQPSSCRAISWPTAKDGNGDGRIDLFDDADAIFSIASYLKHYGWAPGIDRDSAYKVVYHYNHSKYYVKYHTENQRAAGRLSHVLNPKYHRGRGAVLAADLHRRFRHRAQRFWAASKRKPPGASPPWSLLSGWSSISFSDSKRALPRSKKPAAQSPAPHNHPLTLHHRSDKRSGTIDTGNRGVRRHVRATPVVPSSRGLGRRPLTPVTRVRIPLGSPNN